MTEPLWLGPALLKDSRATYLGVLPWACGLWLGPSPIGYLFQNPGHAVKQHSEKGTLKERPLRLMGVQRCESHRPAPGGHSGAALLELKQEQELKCRSMVRRPQHTEGTTPGGGLGALGQSLQRRKVVLKGEKWAVAEASTLTSP